MLFTEPLKFKPMFTCVNKDKNVSQYPEARENRYQAAHHHGVQGEVDCEGGGGGAGENYGHCVRSGLRCPGI